MAHATLSLLGLYNYDPSILDDLQLPKKMESYRDTLNQNLLLETAELEVVYPDPSIMKTAIKAWSSKQLNVWTELYDTTQYEYNPIWNKDGSYKETHLETRDLTETRDLQESRNLAGSSLEGINGSSNTKDYVFGFNSTQAAQSEEHTTTTGGSDNITTTSTGTVDNDGTVKDQGTIKHEIERTEKGNIGITTTQQMIKEQREVVALNMIDYIITDFKQRFCLMIY